MSLVTYHLEDHVATITLNRPETHNAINNPLRQEINAAWDRFRGEEEAWVGILTATGDVFCAGGDLKDGEGSVGTFAGTFWEKPTNNSFERGMEIGLVWKLVEPEDLQAEARSWARTLTEAAPLAQRATKEVAWRTADMG